MNMITIYGDFNCPYCYLASQRADLIIGLGLAAIDWRAVEHDPRLAVTGTRSDAGQAAWDQELAEVAAVALPGEQAPPAAPPVLSNTQAAVAAALAVGESRARVFGRCALRRGRPGCGRLLTAPPASQHRAIPPRLGGRRRPGGAQRGWRRCAGPAPLPGARRDPHQPGHRGDARALSAIMKLSSEERPAFT